MNWALALWVGVPAIAIGGYVFSTYNKFVNLNVDVDRQASHVQAHLKQKFDLIPALAEVVKGYATHEKGTFEEVTRLRSQWGAAKNTNDKMRMASQLEATLSKLLFVQERYPKLKADRSFQRIMGNISRVEGGLLHERKIYNKRVSWYNAKIQEFPSNIIAKMFGFNERSFYGREGAEA